MGENLAINFVVFTLFIYRKNKKNGSVFNDYIHCDSVGKMCITNGKIACQVHNYRLFLFFFVRELSIPKIPLYDLGERSVLYIMLGGWEESIITDFLNHISSWLIAPFLHFNTRVTFVKGFQSK